MTDRFRTVEVSDPAASFDGLSFMTVKSASLGMRADITFYLPPLEQQPKDMPLLVLLHGVYGSHWAWALKGSAHVTAARLIGEGALPPIAIAMPSDGLWGDGSGYVAHAEQDFEHWIIDDVPAAARELSASVTENSPLLIAGLSMGGFAALRFAGKYPQLFTAAAAHSAITDVAELDALIAETRARWSTDQTDKTVLGALTAASAPLPPIRFDCGLQDAYLEPNRALHHDLDALGIEHIYAEAKGGHDWGYWSREIEKTLRFFGRQLQQQELRK
ncbi:MAG TPA: alpha/beta fold hydrolase [Sphingomicrobium sp.]|nr:alpha/beta fold hydrolase [Sphingomicrobium sp.]